MTLFATEPAATPIGLGTAMIGAKGRLAKGERRKDDYYPTPAEATHALMLAEGRVLSREQLEQQIYGWGQEVESNAVEVHVHHLRRKLRPELIQTVRGIGYALARPAA